MLENNTDYKQKQKKIVKNSYPHDPHDNYQLSKDAVSYYFCLPVALSRETCG